MIACPTRNAKVYYWTYNTSSDVVDATDDTTNVTVCVVNDGWQEVSSEAFVCQETKFEEPAQEQEEPNTGGWLPVHWERPNRRLATVTDTRDRPRQLESSFG